MGGVGAHQPVDQIFDAGPLLIFLRKRDADHAARGGVHRRLAQLPRVHFAQALEAADVDFLALERACHQLFAMNVVACVNALSPGGQTVERRLGEEEVPAPHQLGHFLKKERHEQRGDMCAVHVRVGHDDDALIADIVRVAVLPSATADCLDEIRNLLIGQDLGRGRRCDIQDLAPDREDRLRLSVPRLLGAAARRVTFHNE